MKLRKLLALLLVCLMVVALFAGCNNTPAEPSTESESNTPAESEEPAASEEPATESDKANTLVVATADFSSKFSPFFATTAYDQYIGTYFTQVSLLGTDREGNPVLKGIEGETRSYNGTDYTYYGIADCDVTENADGTVDYKLTIRDDIVFSDGEPLTMADVLFSLYTICDPTYDGSSTFYALPIEGMDAFRSGMDSLMNLILAAGEDGKSEFASDDQTANFWAAYNAAGEKFAQEIVDYCLANYADYGAEDVTTSAALWGFELDEGATAADFFAAIREAYGDSIGDMEAESAGSSLLDLINEELGDTAAEYAAGVETGESASSISGIQVLSDTELNIHMTEVDATAIYQIGQTVAPLHYYGDPALYNGEDSFGFNKGDLSLQKAKTAEPLGAGQYAFESYDNATVTLKANPYYFEGTPKTEYILFKETSSADMLTGISSGSFDLTADAAYNVPNAEIIRDYNSNKETTGDVYTTISVDNLGYGYIGINADLVKVGDDRGSEESKNLRKAFATLFSVYRDTVIDSYYGELAQVINYPISNTSWAAPKPADEGYEIAYSKDVDGNPIYTEGMTEEEKYAAALEAAKGYFEAAGFKADADGMFTDVPEFTAVIPADGTGDHPAYKILTNTKEALESIGVKFEVNDVADGNILWDGLDANTIAIWAAAWGSTSDPDMYQVYHSSNVSGQGTGSNHYYITSDKLDELIIAGRSSVDQSYRKATYKDALNEILDWAVEVPTYQRQNATLVSTERVNVDTITPDITPFWSWYSEAWKVEMN